MTMLLPRQKLKREFALDPSLVLYLPLYELDGVAFTSKDHYGHLATVTGAVWRPDGRSFDGTDDNVTVPDCAGLSGLSAMTVMAWGKTNTWVVGTCLASKYWHANLREWYLSVTGAGNPSSPKFVVFDETAGANLSISPTATINLFTDDWFCLMACWGGATDGSDMELDINGVNQPVTVTPTGVFVNIDDTVQDVLIGEIGNLARDYNGLIGEFAQWNVKKTMKERQDIYLNTRWRYR